MSIMRIPLFLTIVASIGLMSCASRKQEAGDTPNTSAAPNFALQASDGSSVTLSSLRGKVVVLNFWATWCGPCRAEMPGMTKVYDRLRSQGLEIVGISLDRGGWSDVRPFLQKTEVHYPVVIGDNDLAQAYHIPDAIPFTVFVDRNGSIAQTHVGYMEEGDFEQQVKKLL